MALQHILGHFGCGQLPNHTVPGQASEAVYQYLVYILSPVIDNCSSWISGRRRMAIEIFSRPNLHERMCQMWGSNSGPLACQANTLPIKLPHPAFNKLSEIHFCIQRRGTFPNPTCTYSSFLPSWLFSQALCLISYKFHGEQYGYKLNLWTRSFIYMIRCLFLYTNTKDNVKLNLYLPFCFCPGCSPSLFVSSRTGSAGNSTAVSLSLTQKLSSCRRRRNSHLQQIRTETW